MPTITRFDGLTIHMYPKGAEHPPLHFHVTFNNKSCTLTIDKCEILNGNIPASKLKRVREWWEIYYPYLYWMLDECEIYKLPPLPRKKED